jgi:choice-of-anchor B domain-containing protein
MKRYLLFVFFTLIDRVYAQPYQSLNMQLLSQWQDSSLQRYQGCWGYAAQGREYAFIGSNYGTHILDVTDALCPQLLATFAGKDTNVRWREYKTYQHYLYAIADGAANSLQIFDLSELPKKVHKVYDSDSLSQSSHSLFIDEKKAKLYLFSNKRNERRYAAEVFSLNNPIQPKYESTVFSPNFEAVHGGFVKNDTAYFSAQTEGLFVYHWSKANSWQPISSITVYPEQGFNHSCWLSENHDYLLFTDETFNSSIKLYDISDKANPTFVSLFKSNTGAIPHYAYWKNNKIYVAYYHDGVQVFDVNEPTLPQRIAFFDTHPENDVTQIYNGFAGCWGIYPFLPSGNIIASDMSKGFFLLKDHTEPQKMELPLSIYPNPATEGWYIHTTSGFFKATFQLIDAKGRVVQQGQMNTVCQCAYLAATTLNVGVYWLRLKTDQQTVIKRLVKF